MKCVVISILLLQVCSGFFMTSSEEDVKQMSNRTRNEQPLGGIFSPFFEIEDSSDESRSVDIEDLVLTIGFESAGSSTSTTTESSTTKKNKKPNRGK